MNRKNKSIAFGDKIFARVTHNGQTIYNFVSERIANMAQLISELRLEIKDVQGLVMIHIRNYNQGWGDERPLMLYARKINSHQSYSSQIKNNLSQNSQRQMYFPWETH